MSDFNVTSKEIAPGIFLHKQQITTSSSKTDNDIIYIFKVELQKLNTLEFVADFSGSENVLLEDNDKMVSITKILPFSTQIVAKLLLKKEWKLKSKFKFTLKPAPKEFQMKYIQNDLIKLKNEMQQSFNILQKYPISLIPFNDVLQILNSHHIQFIDFEFPPLDESIFSLNIDATSLDTVVQWRRPQDFAEVAYFLKNFSNSIEYKIDPGVGLKEPNIFYDVVEPMDVKQGILGDHWLMSALASLTERPALIERLFITKEVNAQGIYRVKLCKNGEWVTVTIDDFFPCYAMGGPLFSRCQNNELWAMLLEKAYAKLHGSYFLLRGGYSNEALIDLTGCPSVSYNFEDEEVLEMIKTGKIWDILRAGDEEGYLMSASTEGEERWADLGINGEDEGNHSLLPGHSYTVLQIKEFKNNALVNIRNPWGQFDWNGDWSARSKLWTLDAINELNPNLEENDGTFWMAYQDFVSHFKALNICKVKNWDEVRIKGKFIRVQDIEDSNIEVVMSKWYYSVDIQEKTRIIISIHQEDERIQGVMSRRPYLDVGVIILKKSTDGCVILHDMKDLEFERQIELEVDLDPGSYIVLPKTTGCTLRRPADAVNENLKMLDKNRRLNELVHSTIIDIFRKYDMLLTRELTYVEFKGFYECLNKTISQQEFETQVLNNYSSTQRGLTLAGFIEFFKDAILTYGEETIFQWFNLLGYDRDLYSVRSRCFLITFHSEAEISVVVRDNVQTDLDNRSNVLLISKYGKDMEVKKGIRAFYALSKNVHAYSYAVVNDQNIPVEVTLDCSGSKNMLFSTKTPIVKKRIEPGVLEFMLHAEALPYVDNFVRSAKCIWMALNEKI